MVGAVLGAKPLPVQNPAMQALQMGRSGQAIHSAMIQREIAKQKMALDQKMAPYRQGLLSAQTGLANEHIQNLQQMTPSTIAMHTAIANMTQKKVDNPYLMAAGPAQQILAANQLDKEGNHVAATAIRNAAMEKQKLQEANANWRNVEARLAPIKVIPAHSRGPVAATLVKSGVLPLGNLTPAQKRQASADVANASNYQLLTASGKAAVTMGPAARQNLEALRNIYGQAQNILVNSGIPGLMKMKINDMQSRFGINSPITNLINQAKQYQLTLAKQYQRIEQFPNTDEGFREAQAVVGTPDDIGKMTWPQLHTKMQTDAQLIMNAENAVHHPLSSYGNQSQGALNQFGKLGVGAVAPISPDASISNSADYRKWVDNLSSSNSGNTA